MPGSIPQTDTFTLNKVCNLEDFTRSDIRGAIREVFTHELGRYGQDFPAGYEYRKHWEVAMPALAFRQGGVLNSTAEVLGIGAGNEPTVFWLTNHVRRVFATDLYCASGTWGESANVTMLHDPGPHWPGPWNPRRLVVQHMNALELHYEDDSFDGIFSSSSLEHFGTLEDVRRSMSEMFRVLKPGGVLSLSTEFRIEGPPPGLPGVLMFDRGNIDDVLIGGLAWDLMSPLDLEVSPATRATETRFSDALKDLSKHTKKNSHILFHKLDWSRYPHIVLKEKKLVWTSVHIALRKRTP